MIDASPATLRRAAIRAIIACKPTVNGTFLAALFDVSIRTIENDIAMMIDEGLVEPRVHRRGRSALGDAMRRRG